LMFMATHQTPPNFNRSSGYHLMGCVVFFGCIRSPIMNIQS
jgi:hypothetical protein